MNNQERIFPARIVGFLALCLAGPAYMVGRDHLPMLVYQLRMLPVTLLLGVGIFLALKPEWLPWPARWPVPTWPRLLAVLGMLLVALNVPMHWVQVHRYKAFGYDPDWFQLVAVTLMFLLAFGVLGWRRHQGIKAWAALILLAWAFGAFFSLAYYPLNTGRSDMLYLLWHGGTSLLHGRALTDAYSSPPGVRLTYLPGLWLTYLPATAADVDLRWVSDVGVLASAGLLLAAAPPARRPLALVLLACFLLSPWMQFRHETYILGMLPVAALACWAVARGRIGVLALAAAWMATQSQLAWMVLPFLLWHARRRWGWGVAVGIGAAILAAMAAVIGPFWVWARAGFVQDVFGTWQNVLWPESPNLSYWVTLVLPFTWLRPLQAGLMVALFLGVARRLGRPAEALKWASLGLWLFILFNSLVRDYFFFYPALFLAFALVIQEPDEPMSGPSKERQKGLKTPVLFAKKLVPKGARR